jgi:branched-chain amino acid transport system permease protein
MAIALERFFLRPLEGKLLSQVLITIGIALIFQDLCLVVWGADAQWLKAPPYLTQNLYVLNCCFAGFRIFIIALAIVVALGLWWLQEKTRFGIMLRASTNDREMAQGCGIKFPLVSMGAFALGGGLGALSGVVGSAFLSVAPGVDFEILPYPFAAVVIGGLGSLRGVVLASVLLGLLDNFGKALFPELSYFTMFAPMAIILALRPRGLFGRAD